MKIPFDIKYRPQIESGEYKVETIDGRPARIICWDKKSEKKYGYHIVGLVEFGPQHEESTYYTIDGKGRLKDKEPDLFIITPEPELSEFEKGCIRLYQDGRDDGLSGYNLSDENLKECSAELLELARKELIKRGYVIEKKAFHDAVEKIDDKDKAAMSVEYSIHCKVENGTRHAVMNWEEFQKVAQRFIDSGKAEALKDLPRWKKYNTPGMSIGELSLTLYSGVYEVSDHFIDKGLYIPISALEKLPGFKED